MLCPWTAYTGFPRVGDKKNLFILALNRKTITAVQKEELSTLYCT
jgi:hypothetical protein